MVRIEQAIYIYICAFVYLFIRVKDVYSVCVVELPQNTCVVYMQKLFVMLPAPLQPYRRHRLHHQQRERETYLYIHTTIMQYYNSI